MICLGTRQKVVEVKTKATMFPIKLLNTPLKFSTSVRNLGVIFDENLTWSSHTSDIVKRTNFKLKQLSTFRREIDKNLKKKLVDSLVQPIFDYGDVVYYGIGVGHGNRLQKAHNNCVRFITGIRRHDNITDYRRQLGYDTLIKRRKSVIIRSFLNCLQPGLPGIFTDDSLFLQTFTRTLLVMLMCF
jgi:hypothetical protein